MGQAVALLVLRAHTGIHAGAGQEVGTVDLPIQRERVTNFPLVRGPSLKGALRQVAKETGLNDDAVTALFGPENSEYAGALSVGDARLLLFPMRSLKGTFAWTTCPFALRRLQRDLDDAGLTLGGRKPLTAVPDLRTDSREVQVASSASWVALDKPAPARTQQPGTQRPISAGKMVVVEDYGFDAKPSPEVDGLATDLKELGLEETELKGRLVVLGDDHFQNFVSFSTEVVTRVHLEDTTKTVKRGQLWTEELLPAESVLVALLLCTDDRKKRGYSGMQLLGSLKGTLGRRLQIGGNETVGYGICHLEWLGPFELASRGEK